MIKRIALLLLLLLLNVPNPVKAAGEPGITGQIIDGTAGGGAVGGLAVTLTTYINSAPSGETTTISDDQGKYEFTGLSTNSTYSYDVYIVYKGVEYASNLVQLTDSDANQTADVTVYETTDNDANISVTTGHMIVVPVSPGLLNILEIWAFDNAGDRTFVGAPGDDANATAHFSLPPGSSDFSSDTGITANMSTGIVTYSLPLIPGSNSVGFVYSMTYQANKAAITLPIDYSTPSFSVLMPQNGIVGHSTTLTESSPQTIQGTTYLYFTGSSLKKGQNIDISLDISSQAFSPSASGSTTQTSSSTPWLWIAVIAVIVFAGGAFVYLMKKRSPQAVNEQDDTQSFKRQLLLDIANLDDDFENGKLEKETYDRLRAQKKSQLIGLMQSSKEESGSA